MATKVTAFCNTCTLKWEYFFGETQELSMINLALNYIEQNQKNLFVKENFFEFINKSFSGKKDFESMPQETKNKSMELFYNQFVGMFSDEERAMLESNILLKHNLEIYPIYLSSLPEDERKVMNIPLLSLWFLNQEEYKRRYNPEIIYIQFTKEQDYLVCPKCQSMSAAVIAQDQV
ncbi:hypothetical protein ABC468_02115 [Mycoplasmopsis synoviae]|uniref:hypothetical protein n=1 Tax=Mycoplasmopsis synoviae TaxID=2109 RepID=UPI001C57302E|nr:hypothetical protein [Mycoplasmopsis synoviae]QXV99363.1 hypothetical protein KXD88_02905 [Mycoplasmopsis synoviae]UBX98199.1 hypothetical protein K6987_00710 [Mycoplasmopsis synoviae]